MSTKELKRVLGKTELMGIAIGQIIGAGVMCTAPKILDS